MRDWPVKAWRRVVVQGAQGAYAHMAVGEVCPQAEVMFAPTFEEAFEMVAAGKAEGAAIPIENSTMGRIADIHHLMPRTRLHILGEHYLPVRHCLLGVKGASLSDVKRAVSQLPALVQCRETLRKMGIEPVAGADTAGSAKLVAEAGDRSQAAIASRKAGEVYGLEVLGEMNDEEHNTTRFVLLGREEWSPAAGVETITTVLFRVRDVPAALYKALGGFATNGISLTKLESYIMDGDFKVAQFYVDCLGHVESAEMARALEELRFFSDFVKVLGCYPAAAQKS